MPVASVTTAGVSIAAVGRTLVVRQRHEILAHIKLIDLERLVVAGGVNLTTPAIKLLLREGVPVSFVTQRGQVIGTLQPVGHLKASKLRRQYAVCADEQVRLRLARHIVAQKVFAMIELLRRYLSNHQAAEVVAASEQLLAIRELLTTARCLGSLRGLEGRAAVIYWHGYRHLLRAELTMGCRTTRPPRDAVSALLSYGYAVLTTEVEQVISSLGYDSAVGVYHECRAGRPALALDLMEPLRHTIIDRLVQRLVNLRQMTAKDFRPAPNGGVWLASAAAKRYVSEYEELMGGHFDRTKPDNQMTTRQEMHAAVNSSLAEMFGQSVPSTTALADLGATSDAAEVIAHGT